MVEDTKDKDELPKDGAGKTENIEDGQKANEPEAVSKADKDQGETTGSDAPSKTDADASVSAKADAAQEKADEAASTDEAQTKSDNEAKVESKSEPVSKVDPEPVKPASSDDGQLKAPRSARQAIEPETPPPPPTRSKAVRHPVVVFLNFVVTVVLLGVLTVAGLLYYGKQTFIEEGPLTQEKTVLVSRGTGLATIASILEQENIISDKTVFEYGVKAYQQQANLKAGEYLFNPGISMHQVMNVLTSGKSILHSITIPEGYTSYQVHALLEKDSVLVGDLGEVPAEGSILPETYKFSRGTTRADMLKRMMDAHTRAVDEIWARRTSDLPLKDKQEMVTLASIVEKETGMAGERTRVAGVFVNRLNKGMKLQTDPTVIYGIFGGKGKPSGRPIFRSDLDKKTPYNTYQIEGLPPGPIANPGRAALEAVANPSRTKDLFFVADGTGGHAFAETLAEHNRNVKRWRQLESQRIDAQKKAGEADASAN
ncbi:endolytic transglycosylase MltG [Cohaesibacter sp. CAU 1516]|uniref:endolytic transglycosylase MltG n=1 Tax=Cohaesibacter sp. CAU 1516 TaxID=2576038 RepID=UPI0010FE1872|nr:endolytic transglycosylase MltG [Cohaesibacter sp. CAU 1516]TLP48914.1 endolytic transglycosylase MltG [Cohaesibacter sp. CAU 1516]